jgi:hypothetical protein
MDDCCVKSFVDWGFRTGFRTGDEGEQHTCKTCGQVFELKRNPKNDTPTHKGYTWQPVVH